MSLIEKFITQWLPQADVDFLTELLGEYGVDVPAAKAGKHQEL